MNPIRAAVLVALALGPTAAQAGMTDTEILNKIHSIDLGELKAADLAKTKSTDKKVQKFASQMTTDHSKADAKVSDLAKKKGITLEDKAPAPDPLSTMSGADFDRGYINAMVKGHAEALSFLDQADSTSADADVKKLVEDLRPTVAHHKKMAEKIQGEMKSQASL